MSAKRGFQRRSQRRDHVHAEFADDADQGRTGHTADGDTSGASLAVLLVMTGGNNCHGRPICRPVPVGVWPGNMAGLTRAHDRFMTIGTPLPGKLFRQILHSRKNSVTKGYI
jgi:hypothetical protein